MNLSSARRFKAARATAAPNWNKPPGMPAGADRVPPGGGFPIGKILAINLGVLKDFAGLGLAEALHFVSFGFKRIQDGTFKLKPRPDLGLADVFANVENWESFESFDDFFK